MSAIIRRPKASADLIEIWEFIAVTNRSCSLQLIFHHGA